MNREVAAVMESLFSCDKCDFDSDNGVAVTEHISRGIHDVQHQNKTIEGAEKVNSVLDNARKSGDYKSNEEKTMMERWNMIKRITNQKPAMMLRVFKILLRRQTVSTL